MMTKHEVVTLVSAMPDSSFERCSGFELEMEPTKAEKILVTTLNVAIITFALLPLLAIAANGVRHAAKKGDGWLASWKARKAAKTAKDAAVNQTLDENTPPPTQG